MSPANSTRSSSTHATVSPRVCVDPSASSRTRTPPRSMVCFMVEEHIGAPELHVLQQIGHNRRPARERSVRAEPELVEILLLRPRDDELRRRRKRRTPRGVLGVKMGRHQIEVGIPAHLGDLAQNRLRVSWTEARVDNHGRAPADDDADIGDERNAVVRNDVDVVRDLDGRVFLDHGQRRLRRQLRRHAYAGRQRRREHADANHFRKGDRRHHNPIAARARSDEGHRLFDPRGAFPNPGEMLARPSEPLSWCRMRIDDYLRKIGVAPPVDGTLDTLKRVHLAHRETFLFDNLSIQRGGGVSLIARGPRAQVPRRGWRRLLLRAQHAVRCGAQRSRLHRCHLARTRAPGPTRPLGPHAHGTEGAGRWCALAGRCRIRRLRSARADPARRRRHRGSRRRHLHAAARERDVGGVDVRSVLGRRSVRVHRGSANRRATSTSRTITPRHIQTRDSGGP